ncbi:hypothetical protein ACOBQX_19900 [Actinokineospora sp. G85]|uniref:hypothetical protein n=1 Tax=Actinokineospora sp. G85 TaxID=3406626 RepID=UPI003C76E8FD
MRGLTSGSSSTGTYARRVLARHVPVLGGVGGATAGARAGRSGVQRLGALLAGVGGTGLENTLTSLGLGSLVGRNRFDVLDELITYITGDGNDLDSQAARDAACDVLDEVFGEADTWTELSDTAESAVTRENLPTLLEAFLAQYVYNRVPVIAERLSRIADPHAVRKADEEMRQIIQVLVSLRIPDDPFAVDWAGQEGHQIAEDTVRSTYETLQGLDGDAQ